MVKIHLTLNYAEKALEIVLGGYSGMSQTRESLLSSGLSHVLCLGRLSRLLSFRHAQPGWSKVVTKSPRLSTRQLGIFSGKEVFLFQECESLGIEFYWFSLGHVSVLEPITVAKVNVWF